MTNPDYTHLLVVVDRSGSMAGIREDMIGGLNAFFKEQDKVEGKCLVDYVQFDNVVETVYENTPVYAAEATLEPRGSTALLDAIGKSVTDLGKKLRDKAEKDRPGTVIVVVVTDGHENASREWKRHTIRNLIKTQEEKWNWSFTFLGANMDAVAVGTDFGFRPDMSLTYNTGNIGAMSASLAGNTTVIRGGAKGGYSDEDRIANK